MLNRGFPVSLRENGVEMVVVMFFFRHLSQKTVLDLRLCIDRVSAGHIQGYRVKGSEHTDVWHNGRVIFRMAVAVRGHIDHKADVEIGASVHNGFCVLCNLAV